MQKIFKTIRAFPTCPPWFAASQVRTLIILCEYVTLSIGGDPGTQKVFGFGIDRPVARDKRSRLFVGNGEADHRK
jgi:hypothetical protein